VSPRRKDFHQRPGGGAEVPCVPSGTAGERLSSYGFRQPTAIKL
jgi:hypothetical protein